LRTFEHFDPVDVVEERHRLAKVGHIDVIDIDGIGAFLAR
jgi:hypothetical protein